MTKVLILDDDQAGSEFLQDRLLAEGFKVAWVGNPVEGLSRLRQEAFDILLLDVRLENNEDGLELLKQIKQEDPDLTVIIITAYGNVEKAVQAMKDGAYDFIEKPINLGRLVHTLRRAEERISLMKANRALQEELKQAYGPLVARSKAMQGVLKTIRRIAPTDATVLIQGETGTGKELVAWTIHSMSLRRTKPFVVINPAVIPQDLMESELFGYEKGAFTHAFQTKRGRLELADGGTVLLDEIGDLTLPTQVHLLRFLERKSFTRLGGLKTIEVDVRILVATNRNLLDLVAEGKFREDLFFRLNVIPICLPPLRERKEDILPLAEYFIKIYSTQMNRLPPQLSEGAKKFLLEHPFPGNVRELQYMVNRALILSRDPQVITGDDLQTISLCPPSSAPQPPQWDEALREFKKERIQKVLEQCQGNITKAAQILGISRSYLSRLVNRWKIRPH